MAVTRYWVGGAGTWDTSSTAHWSATDGGAGGASAPVDGDAVNFTALSGAGVVNITSTAIPCNFETTGSTQTFTGSVTAKNDAGLGYVVKLGTGATHSSLNLTVQRQNGFSADIYGLGRTLASLTLIGAGSGQSIALVDALTITGALTLATAATGVELLLKNGLAYGIGSLSIAQPASGGHWIRSLSGGAQTTLSDSSGINPLNYVTIRDLALTGGAEWPAGLNFADSGNSSGYTRSVPQFFSLELF